MTYRIPDQIYDLFDPLMCSFFFFFFPTHSLQFFFPSFSFFVLKCLGLFPAQKSQQLQTLKSLVGPEQGFSPSSRDHSPHLCMWGTSHVLYTGASSQEVTSYTYKPIFCELSLT